MTLFFSTLSIRICTFAEPKRLSVKTFLPVEALQNWMPGHLCYHRLKKQGGGV